MDQWSYQPSQDHGLAGADRARSLKRESGLLASAGHLVWWSMVRVYLRLYHRFQIINPQRLPTQPPFIVVANHASHLDVMALASPLPHRIRDRVYPIAAGDVFFENPAVALFSAGMLNALPMWRKKAGAKAMRELRRKLIEDPCGYILFPEGTRSRTGEMNPFRAGLGMLVAGSDVPVVPCHLQGAYEAMPPKSKLPRPIRITMRVGEALKFADLPDEREGWEEAARRTEAAVRELCARE